MPLAAVRTKRIFPKSSLEDSVVREVGLQKLLSTRICDLTLKVEDVLFECLAEVTSELRAKGTTFIPRKHPDVLSAFAASMALDPVESVDWFVDGRSGRARFSAR